MTTHKLLTFAKAFITLVSGVLVFSVTFTEKIINWDKADGYSKTMMLACWILLVLAIILCGIGLCLMFAASTAALHPTATINNEKVNILWYIPAYGRVDNYIITAKHSWTVIGMAGCS